MLRKKNGIPRTIQNYNIFSTPPNLTPLHLQTCIKELAEQFRGVAAIEKHHEERYRALLRNVEAHEVFRKAGITVWECRNCGHISIGTEAPEVCPVCFHPQSYFEVHPDNY